MPVYVDDATYPFQRNGRTMLMCHMVADTLDELHEMAVKLGVRRYFQAHPRHPHYDICNSKREMAISQGAIPVSRRTALSKAQLLAMELDNARRKTANHQSG